MSAFHNSFRAIAAALLMAAAWYFPPDRLASEQVEAGMARALATFASARALNAVISVAQGTEVAFQPGGLGMVLAPGQALDPLNDLVEQFSHLMLIASASFGIQRILIEIGGSWLVSMLLSVIVLGWVYAAWRRGNAPRWLNLLLLFLLLVRFAVPLTVLASEFSYRLFMAEREETASAEITRSAGELQRAAPQSSIGPGAADTCDDSLLENLKCIFEKVRSKLDVSAEMKALQERADRLVEHVIELIVVFLLRTVLLPLLFFWLILNGARLVTIARPPAANG